VIGGVKGVGGDQRRKRRVERAGTDLEPVDVPIETSKKGRRRSGVSDMVRRLKSC
jgi:hypothetical protein